MKNYKNIGWIEELPDQLDEKLSVLNLTSCKENKIVVNPCQEISKASLSKK